MLFIVIFVLVLFIIIALFSFPQFSPIPYFPSNKKDLKHIIKALSLKNNQIIFDLGAGDGLVIFEAAKVALKRKLNTQFVAVEINPVLLCILNIRKLLHPNRKNIKVMYGNMFTMNFSFLNTEYRILDTVFYLYISPWYLEKAISNLSRQNCGTNFCIVSYMYPIKSLLKKERKIRGNMHGIYMYNI